MGNYSISSFIPTTLEGTELKVVAYEDPVYIHKMRILRHNNGSIEFASGLCLELLRILQDTLKFKYVPLEDVTYIREFPNKTLYGMGAQVLRGDADFAIAQASMVMLQMPGNHPKFMGLSFISYLVPTSSMKLAAIFRQPDAHTTRNIVTSTFTLRIWVYWFIICVMILVSLLLTRFCLHRLKMSRKRRLGYRKVKYFDVTETVLCVISNMACQGWFKYPKEIPMRWMFMIAMTYAYLCNIFLSAGLTSSLASETVPIKTFEDLKESKLKLLGDRRLPVVKDFLEEIYYTVRKGRVTINKFGHHDLTSHLILIQNSTAIIENSPAAFITFDDAARNVFQAEGHSDRYFCEIISTVSVSSKSLPNAMFVKRGSYLRELFNRKLILAMERGILFRLNSVYSSLTVVSCTDAFNKYRGGLGVEDLTTAFRFLLFGMALSVVILILAKLTNVYHNFHTDTNFIF